MVAVSMPMPSYALSSDMLRVYGRVNILAKLSVKRAQLKTYRVIRGVRVLAIGGRGESRSAGTGAKMRIRRAPRRYRSITVAIPEKISLQLANVLSHRVGDLQIEICSGHVAREERAARINPELRSLAAQAAGGQEAAPAGQAEP